MNMSGVLARQLASNLEKGHIMPRTLMLARLYHGKSQIGKREVVGFGSNGSYSYIDALDYPYPAIRFREDIGEVKTLREKEKGDWKNLTLEEKKTLYRSSFCRTFAELQAPTGEWKSIISGVLMLLSVSLWVAILVKKYVMPPLPESTSLENRRKQLEYYLALRVDPIDGLSSKWDFENNKWK